MLLHLSDTQNFELCPKSVTQVGGLGRSINEVKSGQEGPLPGVWRLVWPGGVRDFALERDHLF